MSLDKKASFGDTVAILEVNMTKTELAAAAKCDLSTVSRILSGKRNASRRVAQSMVEVVKGTRLLDWLFAVQNVNKLNQAVRRAK